MPVKICAESSKAQFSLSGLLSSTSRLKPLATTLLDLIYPPCCFHCARVDTPWCSRCQQLLEAAPVVVIDRSPSPDLRFAATGTHEDILQSAVQGLKYGGLRHLAQPLGLRLANALQHLDWSIDVIAPVPLGEKRQRERRYNQAELLAKSLTEYTSISCQPHAVMRRRETRSQVGLNRQERLENMVEAFEADPKQIAGCNLLIIDDVLTTGATLSACVEAARSAGARAVYGMTVTSSAG
jgi:ComF family protein